MNTYAKIEHGLYENPKIIGLSDKAFRTYLESILYSGNHLTDGFIDERIAKRMGWVESADELTSNDQVNPSWQRVEGGWQIYGYCERQTSRADVEAMREQKSRAGKASVEAKRNRKLTEIQQSVEHTANKSSTKAQPDTDIDTYTDINTNNKRATRIDDNWNLDDVLLAWTKNEAPGINIVREREKFIDYWSSRSGSAATKTDWNRTWKNWIRSNVERNPQLALSAPADPNAWMIAEQIVLP
jgi:hypothetical protein